MRARLIPIYIALLLLYAGSSLAQSNEVQDSTAVAPSSTTPVPDPKVAVPDAKTAGAVAEDPAGRPVQTSPTPQEAPPPVPATERQEFQQNVKDPYFDFDRANLTSADRAILEKDAEWLKAHPNVFFTIAGGADERGTTPITCSFPISGRWSRGMSSSN